jgi:hypothetical protein
MAEFILGLFGEIVGDVICTVLVWTLSCVFRALLWLLVPLAWLIRNVRRMARLLAGFFAWSFVATTTSDKSSGRR